MQRSCKHGLATIAHGQLQVRNYCVSAYRTCVKDDTADLGEPRRALEERVPIEPEDAWSGAAEIDARDFVFIAVPSGGSAENEVRCRTERWVEEMPTGTRIDLKLGNTRILMRGRRCAVIGPTDHFDCLMTEALELIFFDKRLRALEDSIAGLFRDAEQDVALTNRVDKAALARWDHISRCARSVTSARLQLVQIASRFSHPVEALHGPACRLIKDGAKRLNVPVRVEALEAKLDLLGDMYDLANDRISEFSYFYREYRLEYLILITLVLELVFIVYDLFVAYY